MVGIVGLEPTEAERPSDLQSLVIAAIRYALKLVQQRGIEPLSHAWEAHILPMYYCCVIINGAVDRNRTCNLMLGRHPL